MTPGRVGRRCSALALAAGLLLVAVAGRAPIRRPAARASGCCPTSATCRRSATRPALAGRVVLADRPRPSACSGRCCGRPPTASSGCSAAPRRYAAASSAPDIDKTVHEFRVEQVLWGLVGFAVAAAYGVLRALARARRGALVAAAVRCRRSSLGVLARDNHLTSQVARPRAPDPAPSSRPSPSCSRWRSRRARARSPRSTGSYAAAAASSPRDLGRVLADVRTGEPVGARLRPAGRRAPGCRWSPGSPRASPSRSSAAPRSPTCCTPRPPTSARPGAAS